MSLHISKNQIRASGSDANALFIAMMSTETLTELHQNAKGTEEFNRMVSEELARRQQTVVEVKP